MKYGKGVLQDICNYDHVNCTFASHSNQKTINPFELGRKTKANPSNVVITKINYMQRSEIAFFLVKQFWSTSGLCP